MYSSKDPKSSSGRQKLKDMYNMNRKKRATTCLYRFRISKGGRERGGFRDRNLLRLSMSRRRSNENREIEEKRTQQILVCESKFRHRLVSGSVLRAIVRESCDSRKKIQQEKQKKKSKRILQFGLKAKGSNESDGDSFSSRTKAPKNR